MNIIHQPTIDWIYSYLLVKDFTSRPVLPKVVLEYEYTNWAVLHTLVTFQDWLVYEDPYNGFLKSTLITGRIEYPLYALNHKGFDYQLKCFMISRRPSLILAGGFNPSETY